MSKYTELLAKHEDLEKRFVESENEFDRILGELESQVNVLEEVLIKSGIIEDLDLSDVLYRTQKDLWSYNFAKKIPFVVNEAKVKP
jgi:hypothetical protein